MMFEDQEMNFVTGQLLSQFSEVETLQLPKHLQALESEAIHILRDGVAQAENPVLLFSAGKDSTVLAHLAVRAFFPEKPPLPLLHVDSTWEFKELLAFRNQFAQANGFQLVVHANEEGRSRGLDPIKHGDIYTSAMRTEALKQALDNGEYDVIFGGARRDEEASRAKERIVSVRSNGHGWEPRNQRPEFWKTFNWRKSHGQTLRVYPISNWTEADLWLYIVLRKLALVPLYFAKTRTIVERSGQMIVVDEPERWDWTAGDKMQDEMVRFRTLGCWPVTAAVRSEASTPFDVMQETVSSRMSERRGRVSDKGSLERQKRDGYF